MPTITLNKNVFEKLVGKKLPIEKLKDRISMLGTDLEKIENNQIEVEIFPNRPDLLSEQGLARAFSSFIGVKTGLRKYKIKNSNQKVIIDKSLKNIRPYTACAIIKNLKLDDEKIREIIQIQEKLHITYGRNRKKVAIGIYPLEHIKLPIRFLAKKPEEIKFQPLEYPSELTAKQILEKHPTGKEYGYLLEGKNQYPIFIDANNKILSMPPIINSHDTGKVTEKTKEVFIECSGFDFEVLSKCLNIIVTALADMGADIYSMELNYPDKKRITPNLNPSKMILDVDYSNKILGLKLTPSKTAKLLERMGFGIEKIGKKINVLIPAYRSDILHQVDFIEDIAIAYGYENFKEEIPRVATIAHEDKFEIFKRKISNILIGLNLLETHTYCITNKKEQSQKMDCKIEIISLANALTTDYNALRAWVIPSLMKVLSENKHHEYPQNLFEIGTIFKENKKEETGVEENDRLAVVLCGKDVNFTKIKQVMDVILDSLELKYSSKEISHNSFIPGRVARISVKNKDIAYIGEIHPKVLNNFALEMPVAALELNISELYKLFK